MKIQVRFNKKDDCYMATCDEYKNLIGYGKTKQHTVDDLNYIISVKNPWNGDYDDWVLESCIDTLKRTMQKTQSKMSIA